MKWLRRVGWVWGLLLCANLAFAQEQVSGTDEEGRGFFIAGRAAYLAGRYDEALERFERSYEMSGRAELLYNIGAAAERAGKLARALEAFRAFQELRPESELHGEIDARVRELEIRIATEPEPSAELTAPPPPPPAPSAAASERKSALGPALSLAASGAVLGTGVVLAVLGFQAKQRVQDAPDGSTWADYERDADRAVAFPAAGFALGAVGVAGAALSSWWLVSRRKDTRGAALVVGRAFIGYRGSF